MPEVTVKLVNVSNPAVYGVEWAAGDAQNRYQLVNLRGTASLLFGVWDGQTWMTTRVVDPSRFGLTHPCKSFREFEAVAQVYVSGGEV